jgi:serine/threonine-protein kinase
VGARVSQNGQINGTAAYLAPEYVEKERVTPQIDVYQMGLIFAEMVAGLPAVRSTSPMACLARHMTGELELPMEALGEAYGEVLRRAVARDPEQRYVDAGEFRTALVAATGAPAEDYLSTPSYEVQVLDPTSNNELRAHRPDAPPALPTRRTRRAPPPTRRVDNLTDLLAADRIKGPED